ncbi:hypothetical protein SLEP1_g51189 [Rubroshorea leprosula]|uniref:Uncharacterized protein n=1 Tax=Rubroshorea leprosula TaxID=152421 RepID=A0AAV5M5N3_9ROSI|nr:hypothetical protein SLEP1_g51189 [Rubroshorea leprosula]
MQFQCFILIIYCSNACWISATALRQPCCAYCLKGTQEKALALLVYSISPGVSPFL